MAAPVAWVRAVPTTRVEPGDEYESVTKIGRRREKEGRCKVTGGIR